MKDRSKSRQFAVQALYSWLLTGQDVSELEIEFLTDHDMGNADTDYFRAILHHVCGHKMALVDHMSNHLSRPFDEVDPVEQAILLIGVYELEQRLDVPYRVVLNEAVESAKIFGAEEGHKFINGILDKIASRIRNNEVNAPRIKKPRKK